jgi:hypothetical protein
MIKNTTRDSMKSSHHSHGDSTGMPPGIIAAATATAVARLTRARRPAPALLDRASFAWSCSLIADQPRHG